jgi:hypothetical protein
MLWWRATGHHEFFSRRPEVVSRAELAAAPAGGPEA